MARRSTMASNFMHQQRPAAHATADTAAERAPISAVGRQVSDFAPSVRPNDRPTDRRDGCGYQSDPFALLFGRWLASAVWGRGQFAAEAAAAADNLYRRLAMRLAKGANPFASGAQVLILLVASVVVRVLVCACLRAPHLRDCAPSEERLFVAPSEERATTNARTSGLR